MKDSKPWYKVWWIWLIAFLAFCTLVYALNPEIVEEDSINVSESSKNEPTELKQWTELSKVVGDTKQKSGDTFQTDGGNIRIRYDVVAASNTGTALIYLLPEGSTISQNAEGELDVAVQDVSIIGSEKGEKIIQKTQGNYYVFVNTSSIQNYEIIVEQQ